MLIEDGKGNGVFAGVSIEKRLRTEAVTFSPQLHASLVYQQAFQAVSGVRQVTPAGSYGLLALLNNGLDEVAVTYIRIGADKTETAQVKAEVLVGGVWEEGTPADIYNMNARSALTPLVDAHYDVEPISANVIDNRWSSCPAEMTWNKEGSIVLPKGGIVSLRVTTETDNVYVHGRISFFIIPKAVSDELRG